MAPAPLVAAEGDDRRMWGDAPPCAQRLRTPTVPAGVLAQTWHGGPQPLLARLLDGCVTEPLDESGGPGDRQLLARARSTDVIDASIDGGAVRRGDAIMTGDRRDLETLANAVGRRTNLIAL